MLHKQFMKLRMHSEQFDCHDWTEEHHTLRRIEDADVGE
jgi:hypothetical protein